MVLRVKHTPTRLPTNSLYTPMDNTPSLLSLPFLLYINDLKTVVPNGVEVTMFADDVSLFYCHPCKLAAQAIMQEAASRAAEWSRHQKMTFNTGDPADPVIIHTSKARPAELTSSYEDEKAGLLLALDWARVNCPTERISICSDSQFLLKAIQSGT